MHLFERKKPYLTIFVTYLMFLNVACHSVKVLINSYRHKFNEQARDVHHFYKQYLKDQISLPSRRSHGQVRPLLQHINKLREVNGYKQHNLDTKGANPENLIYIRNPVEARLPHPFLTVEQFKETLRARAEESRKIYLAQNKPPNEKTKYKTTTKRDVNKFHKQRATVFNRTLFNKVNATKFHKLLNKNTSKHIKRPTTIKANIRKKPVDKILYASRARTTRLAVSSTTTKRTLFTSVTPSATLAPTATELTTSTTVSTTETLQEITKKTVAETESNPMTTTEVLLGAGEIADTAATNAETIEKSTLTNATQEHPIQRSGPGADVTTEYEIISKTLEPKTIPDELKNVSLIPETPLGSIAETLDKMTFTTKVPMDTNETINREIFTNAPYRIDTHTESVANVPSTEIQKPLFDIETHTDAATETGPDTTHYVPKRTTTQEPMPQEIMLTPNEYIPYHPQNTRLVKVMKPTTTTKRITRGRPMVFMGE